jgi:hypothetical protein
LSKNSIYIFCIKKALGKKWAEGVCESEMDGKKNEKKEEEEKNSDGEKRREKKSKERRVRVRKVRCELIVFCGV